MDVGAVIVNFRTAETTIKAVEALLPQIATYRDPLIVVVDNESGDGSSERLHAAFAEPRWNGQVVVLDSGHNGGFGFGNNVGIRHLLTRAQPPRYVYLVNPDAMVEPEALRRLVDFADAHPDAGLVGNVVHDAEGALQVGAFRFPSLWGEIESTARLGVVSWALRKHAIPIVPTEQCTVDWVGGPSMLFRVSALDTVGLFDEKFFLYFEEIDLARRIWDAGWKVYYVPEAGVRHIGSLSTGFADLKRPMPTYWFESRRRYLVKHHGRLYGALCDAAWLSGHALYMIKRVLRRPPDPARPNLGRSFARYSLSNLTRPAPEAPQNAGRAA